MESIQLSVNLPATPKEIYEAWLSSEEHTKFTGDKAVIDPSVGGLFTAGEGYIQGKNLELEPYNRILQSWRTTDFPRQAADSLLEVRLEANKSGTKLTLIQSDIPDGQGEMYAEGWQEYYFEPMQDYFSK